MANDLVGAAATTAKVIAERNKIKIDIEENYAHKKVVQARIAELQTVSKRLENLISKERDVLYREKKTAGAHYKLNGLKRNTFNSECENLIFKRKCKIDDMEQFSAIIRAEIQKNLNEQMYLTEKNYALHMRLAEKDEMLDKLKGENK